MIKTWVPILAACVLMLLSCSSLASDLTASTKKTISVALENGRLSELPKSATKIMAYEWGGLFTGEQFIRFEASADDIEKFVSSSPSIKDVKPEYFTAERQLIPYPDEVSDDFLVNKDRRHEYYFRDRQAPDWFEPTIKMKGREYSIPSKGDHNWGYVIIDDEKHIVFIKVIFS